MALSACSYSGYDHINEELPTYASKATGKQLALYKKEEFFPEKTALELRSMQTRKFPVPLAKLMNAIQTECKDSNGILFGPGECYYKTNFPFALSGEGSFYNWLFADYEPDYSNLTDQDPSNDNSVVVRLRIYGSELAGGSGKTPQFTLPVYYKNQFARLADALFVNALELTPQEMK